MTNDCIGCDMAGELAGVISEIQSGTPPSWLLVEASSLTFQTVKDTIHLKLNVFEPLTVLVLDSAGWLEMYTRAPMLTGTQAERADFILVNRREGQGAEAAAKALSELRSLSPSAPIRSADLFRDSLDDFWAYIVKVAEDGSRGAAQN
jgi:G3E family GTPase